MASLFPEMQKEPEEQPLTSLPADLLSRARQAAQQELAGLRPKPQQPSKSTLLTGHRRFDERGF